MRIWRNNEKELARVVGVVGEGGEGDGSRHVHPPSSSARATGCCVCTSSLAVPRLRQGAEMLIAEENCKTSASIAARATHMLRKVVNERVGCADPRPVSYSRLLHLHHISLHGAGIPLHRVGPEIRWRVSGGELEVALVPPAPFNIFHGSDNQRRQRQWRRSCQLEKLEFLSAESMGRERAGSGLERKEERLIINQKENEKRASNLP
ncbi:hypothetical protein C0Q70_09532 [Pomacea canaliculata]|uniref:Uncharacterized protein n=1 Tax=Pomacea canaliculata TaxID=400727 RepID=A0A2T7PA28_POMCA|nr:hypothetical protein C0Q70_09532 [Pomacea canaliculata]